MTYFLTSSTCMNDTPYLNPANGFVDQLQEALEAPCHALVICSDPDNHAHTKQLASFLRCCFENTGFHFHSFHILDGRNETQAAKLVHEATLIILLGGHVPTQNGFFHIIRLRQLLQDFSGVLLGISAGTMNCADIVYAQPELPGEATAKEFTKYLPGLGITQTMVLPHYQAVKNDILDGLRVFEDIAYPDSMGRQFYALVDGSYLWGSGDQEELRGEAYRIQDGIIQKICDEGGTLSLLEL